MTVQYQLPTEVMAFCGYEVKPSEDGSGFWAYFDEKGPLKHITPWRKTEDELIPATKEIIALLAKNLNYLAMRWKGKEGQVTSVELVSTPTMGPNSELLEISYENGNGIRVSSEKFIKFIEEDVFNGSPEGIAAAAERKRKYEEGVAKELAVKAEQDAKDAAEEAKLTQFTYSLGLTPMKAGQVKKALKVKMNYDSLGGVMARHEFIDLLIKRGDKPAIIEEGKYDKNDNYVTTKVNAIQSADTSYYTVTKSEYDYAQYLINLI